VIIFTVLALLAQFMATWILVYAYLGHGLWDLFHEIFIAGIGEYIFSFLGRRNFLVGMIVRGIATTIPTITPIIVLITSLFRLMFYKYNA